MATTWPGVLAKGKLANPHDPRDMPAPLQNCQPTEIGVGKAGPGMPPADAPTSLTPWLTVNICTSLNLAHS